MQYWWVSQNETFRQETSGGYMWSPKRNKAGNRIRFYDNMTRVDVGDIVLSFESTRISAIGIVTHKAISSDKPLEFGASGQLWEKDGWRVGVDYYFLENRVRPADHMDALRPVLPKKYSPLQASGRGNQAYLFEVPESLFDVLASIIGAEVSELIRDGRDTIIASSEEAHIEQSLLRTKTLETTTVRQLVKARKGQGLFRANVEAIEQSCRITGISSRHHLIASHIKPWRFSSNIERLDGQNGLLLSPHVDHLFDRGYITFGDNGVMIVSSHLDVEILKVWGIDPEINVGTFTESQRRYLQYHRENIFKG